MSVYYKSERVNQQNLVGTNFNGDSVIVDVSYGTINKNNYFPSRSRPEGPLFLNPTTGSFLQSESHMGIMGVTNQFHGNVGEFRRYQFPYSCPGAGLLLTTRDLAAEVGTAIRKDIQNQSQSFAEHIGEYRESVGYLKEAGKILYEALLLKRGKIPPRWARLGKTASTRNWSMRDVSAAWIVSAFAIKPVVQTINDYCYQMSGVDKTTPSILRIRHSKSAMSQDSQVYSNGSFSMELRRKTSQTTVITYYVELIPGAPSFSEGNPAEWVWAAIPFSFVVDWMFKVGTFLKAANNIPPNVKLLGGSQVDIVDATHEYDLLGSNSTDPSYASDRAAIDKYYSLSRNPISSIPFPAVPRWDPPANTGILTTAIALLHLVRKS